MTKGLGHHGGGKVGKVKNGTGDVVESAGKLRDERRDEGSR